MKARLLTNSCLCLSVCLSSDSGNLARGRPTFASSAQSDKTTSGRAVDGVFYESGHAFENCYASEYEKTPWWMLQLDRPYAITSVYIMACGEFILKTLNFI